MASKQVYTFPSIDEGTNVTFTGSAPFTIVLQPSAYDPGSNVIGTITYVVSGVNPLENNETTQYVNTYTRTYTYADINEIGESDSRSSFEYTFYNNISGATQSYIGVTMLLYPSFLKKIYHFTIDTISPYLTVNPNQNTPAGYVFSRVHLLKNRAWGTNNNQLVVAEGRKDTGTNQVFLFNIADIASGANIKPDTPNPSITPTPTPSISISPTPTVTPTNTPTPTSSVTPTVTPTATLTPTVTPTATLTPTVTPTNTPTPSITPTFTPTPSVTQSPPPSVTPTTTNSVTPTITPTKTPTPSVTPTFTPTNSPTPTTTPTSTPPVTPSPTPSVTPPETPPVTPSVTPPETPPVTPPVTPSSTPPETPPVTPTPTETPPVNCYNYQVDSAYLGDDVWIIDFTYTQCNGSPGSFYRQEAFSFSETVCAQTGSLVVNYGNDSQQDPCS